MRVALASEELEVGLVLGVYGDRAGVDLAEVCRDEDVAFVGQQDRALCDLPAALAEHGEARVEDRQPAAGLAWEHFGMHAVADEAVADGLVDRSVADDSLDDLGKLDGCRVLGLLDDRVHDVPCRSVGRQTSR